MNGPKDVVRDRLPEPTPEAREIPLSGSERHTYVRALARVVYELHLESERLGALRRVSR